MNVVRSVAALRDAIAGARGRGAVGFVPTMGALHHGHASLIERARRETAVVVASVFVNPTQFGDPKDLLLYPRPEADDARVAEAAGVDVLFMPEATAVYPSGFATTVHVAGAAIGFEGAHRPGHFDGVATVCVKLFGMVRPDVAYFGQKDAQQVAVISQVVRDLNLPLEIRVSPTVRATEDDVALSSRNARLSPDDRREARRIPAALRSGLDAWARGQDAAQAARRTLEGLEIDYVDVATWGDDPTLVIAVRIGGTRLIDNVPLRNPERAGLDRSREVRGER